MEVGYSKLWHSCSSYTHHGRVFQSHQECDGHVSYNNPRQEEMLGWLLGCPWNGMMSPLSRRRTAWPRWSTLGESWWRTSPILPSWSILSWAPRWDRKECVDGYGGWRPDCPGHGVEGSSKVAQMEEEETRRGMKTFFLYKLQLFLLGNIIRRWTNWMWWWKRWTC